jgi:DNA repair exonuclease SbcCD ATPase subunit
VSSQSDDAKLAELCALPYMAQAVWFTNGFFKELHDAGKMETIYGWIDAFVKLDKLGPDRKGEAGSHLDQFWSAKFLEDNDKAITALERKNALKDIDKNNDGKMSLIEYLLWKFKKSTKAVVDAPQGSNVDALKKAQAQLDAVQKSLDEVIASIEKLRLEREQLAKLKLELEEADRALAAEQKAYNDKCSALETKIADPSTSSMQKSKAQNELAQLKSEDPLPLRRAKITSEAAIRKVEQQEKAVAAAIADMERKQDELAKKLEEAREQLVRIQQQGGEGGKGAIWLMNRKLYEGDSYLPKAKQKFNHSKTFSEQFKA